MLEALMKAATYVIGVRGAPERRIGFLGALDRGSIAGHFVSARAHTRPTPAAPMQRGARFGVRMALPCSVALVFLILAQNQCLPKRSGAGLASTWTTSLSRMCLASKDSHINVVCFIKTKNKKNNTFESM